MLILCPPEDVGYHASAWATKDQLERCRLPHWTQWEIGSEV